MINDFTTKHPKVILRKILNQEVAAKKIKFDGAVSYHTRGKAGSRGPSIKAAKSSTAIQRRKRENSAFEEKRESYQKIMVDPDFYKGLKPHLSMYNSILSAARLGGVIPKSKAHILIK